MSTARKLALATVLLLLLGVFAELLARRLTDARDFTRFGQRVGTWMETGLADFNACLAPDPELFWTLAPDRELPEDRSRPFFGLVSNSRGWRGPEPRPRAPGEALVLCLGDSCTFGFGAAADEAWPARTAARLAGAGRAAQVINAGVPGYASSQGLVLARRLVPALRPDAVVIAFGWNDGSRWDGRTDAQHRAAAAAAPSWLERSRAYLVLRRAVRALLRERAERRSEPARVPLAAFQANLAQLAALCQEWGARPVFVAWPFREQVADVEAPYTPYQKAALQAGAAPGASAVDLVRRFRERVDPSVYLDHGHVGPAGYEAVGAAVAEALLAAGL